MCYRDVHKMSFGNVLRIVHISKIFPRPSKIKITSVRINVSISLLPQNQFGYESVPYRSVAENCLGDKRKYLSNFHRYWDGSYVLGYYSLQIFIDHIIVLEKLFIFHPYPLIIIDQFGIVFDNYSEYLPSIYLF